MERHIEQVDVLIIGSGPAGTSTALHLIKENPDWASRIVIVDKAVHPREKLCGGGITHVGQNVMADLGLPFEPPSFEVREVRLKYEELTYSFYGDPVFRIIRRDEFDHWLVKTAESFNIPVRQGEAITDIKHRGQYVEVISEKQTYHAQVVVAADGSRSFVRRRLKWDDDSRVARLIEVLTPENANTQPEFRDGVAVFDFTRMPSNGLQGYYWDFPSFVDGKPYMNRGIFDSRTVSDLPKADLKKTLSESLEERERQLEDYQLKGHPIRWWSRNGKFSMPRVVLVGDAAGVDPLFGEGIAFALGYGRVAAPAIVDAFERQDYSFDTYRRRIVKDGLFIQLDIRTKAAKAAYRLAKFPRLVRVGWQIAGWVIRLTPWRNKDFVPAKMPKVLLRDAVQTS